MFKTSVLCSITTRTTVAQWHQHLAWILAHRFLSSCKLAAVIHVCVMCDACIWVLAYLREMSCTRMLIMMALNQTADPKSPGGAQTRALSHRWPRVDRDLQRYHCNVLTHCLCAYKYINAYICLLYILIHACMCSHTHTHTFTHTHSIHACMCSHTHTHIHTWYTPLSFMTA